MDNMNYRTLFSKDSDIFNEHRKYRHSHYRIWIEWHNELISHSFMHLSQNSHAETSTLFIPPREAITMSSGHDFGDVGYEMV